MKSASVDESALRAWLVSRAASELGISEAEIDTEAQLMTLGVDSMTLIGMAAELAELIGEDLSADIVWDYPSISALARHLGSRARSGISAADLPGADLPRADLPRVDLSRVDLAAGSTQRSEDEDAARSLRTQRWSPIRALQPNGERTPLFFVHSVIGRVHCYRELVRQLGEDQPSYGLCQPPDPPGTVEQMAEVLLDGLRTIQRKGPYRLGGFCFAGVVAYEMARQLDSIGEEVELLAMFDAPAPARSPLRLRHDMWAWVSAGAATVARGPGFLMHELAHEPGEFGARFTRCLSGWRHWIGKRIRPTQRTNLERFVPDELRGNAEIYVHNMTALQSYSPETYAGSLTLFQSTASQVFHGVTTWKWHRLAGKGARVFEIPCKHNGMMEAAGAAILAQKLRTQLDLLA
jgi:thioesterase domain-containing protein